MPPRVLSRIALTAVLLLVTACRGAAVRPAGAADERPGTPVPTRSLNPYVLTDLVSRRVAVEIDWVAGMKPAAKAVRAVGETLERHCDAGKEIRVVLDDEIPATEWEASGGRAGLERLVARFLDLDPGRWETEEVLYVLYAPRSDAWYGPDYTGMSDTVRFERDGQPKSVRTAVLFTEPICSEELLWVTAARIERSILVHELGHLIGLVANPEHTRREHPAHCTESGCVMSQPDAGARLRNAFAAIFAGHVPYRYGALCTADIEAAQRVWHALAADVPEYVERLKDARIRREAQEAARWREARSLR